MEILIAVGILGGALVVVLTSIQQSLRMVAHAREAVLGSTVAERLLEDYLAEHDSLLFDRVDSGSVDEAGLRFRWTVRVSEPSWTHPLLEEHQDKLEGIRKVDLELRWEGAHGERRSSLATLVQGRRR